MINLPAAIRNAQRRFKPNSSGEGVPPTAHERSLAVRRCEGKVANRQFSSLNIITKCLVTPAGKAWLSKEPNIAEAINLVLYNVHGLPSNSLCRRESSSFRFIASSTMVLQTTGRFCYLRLEVSQRLRCASDSPPPVGSGNKL
ncbi:unnamed protein product, partial [Ceratitis capitata]